ncbi:MAG: Histidine triad (HIT) protein [candidate division TM6 bacterium GW2011_GWF2_37_49]|nr:MAG: Histidine triad (HIT) protein [candidate division TM6 bacterium GW2011_GWF2_37_49]
MVKYEPKTSESKCVFCEIAIGNISKDLVFWQDDEFMAFLSIDPNTEGFSCVIPKTHYGSDVMKMPDNVLQRYILAVKKVSSILEHYFEDVGRIGVLMEGMGIDHAHIKLQPMHETEHLKRGEWKQMLSGKNFWFDKYEGWICSGSGPKANPEVLRSLADKLKSSQQIKE